MKVIPLTQNQYALVDDEDYLWLLCHDWLCQKKKTLNYAVRIIDIPATLDSGKSHEKILVYMHRQIMNTPEGQIVHHVDGNGLNNQKYNLINMTYSEHAKIHYQEKVINCS